MKTGEIAAKIHEAFVAKNPNVVFWTDFPVRQLTSMIVAGRRMNKRLGGSSTIVFNNGYKLNGGHPDDQIDLAVINEDESVTILAY